MPPPQPEISRTAQRTRLRIRPEPSAQSSRPRPSASSKRRSMFNISTRSKSVHGARQSQQHNSCKRNKNPSAKISAPRKIVVRAITSRATRPSRASCRSPTQTKLPPKIKKAAQATFRPAATTTKKTPCAALPHSATRRSNASGTSAGTRTRASSQCRQAVVPRVRWSAISRALHYLAMPESRQLGPLPMLGLWAAANSRRSLVRRLGRATAAAPSPLHSRHSHFSFW